MNLDRAFDELFGGYFHEDWVEDYATWESTVDAFAAENPTTVAAAIRQIAEVLTGGEANAREAVQATGCCFSVDFFGKSYAGWLEDVLARLRNQVEVAPLRSARSSSDRPTRTAS